MKQRLTELHNHIDRQAPTIGPHLPRILFEIGFAQKGCSRTYNKMMTYSTNILRDVKDKWEMTLNEDLSYNIIEDAFKEVTNMNTGAYQKYFQFKLLHNCTITNEKLCKMKISENEICKLCQRESDTIKHAFWDVTQR